MKKPIILFFLLLLSSPIYAQAVDPAAEEQNRQIQRQQQLERGAAEQKELQRVQKEAKEFEEEFDENLEQESGKVVQDLRSIQCFRINQIDFSPNKVIPKLVEHSFTKEYLGKCLTINQMIKLRKNLSNYLVDKGYVTSRVAIPQQNLNNGILNIDVIESGLEKIIFNNETFFDKAQKFTAFGFEDEEEILNLRRIEQGVEQINRLSSSHATIKILPGSRDKTSIIAVENKPQRRTRFSVGYDNNGSKNTGDKRETFGFTQDNLLFLNDSFTMNRTGNTLDEHRKDQGGSNSLSGNFSVPFGWYNLTVSASNSSYHFWQGVGKLGVKNSGRTTTKSIALDRILLKEKNFKISSSFGLTSRYNRSFSGDNKNEVQSRKASIASISLPTTLFFSGASLYLKPTYSKSLNILDAKKDPSNIPSHAAHAEFEMYKFYSNFSKRFSLAQVPTSYNLTFDSQIAEQELNGIDKFYVGGLYSVRGFKEGSISGDSGYNVKNEFTVNLGQLILPHFNQEKLPKYAAQLNRFSLTPFYDYGYVRQKGGITSGRISGTGIKISFAHQNFTSSLTLSQALSKSQLLGSRRHENSALFFNMSAEVGFF